MSSILDVHSHSLYSAATEALVSETSAENTWSKMVDNAVHETDYIAAIKEVEAVIKAEFGVSVMPNPWRSAKSVIKTALALGITLTDANNNPKGKTAVQLEIKQAKAKTIPERTPYEKAILALNVINNMWDELTSPERSTITGLLRAD